MITGAYKGVLQIPMYNSPYSFNNNGAAYQCGSGNSDMPFLYQNSSGNPGPAAQYMMQGASVNGANGMFAGKITMLDYGAPRILTVGSGDTTVFNTTTNGIKTLGGTLGTNQPIMFNNNFVFPVVNGGGAGSSGIGTATEDAPFGACAFGTTRSVGYIPAPSQANINTFTTSASNFQSSMTSQYVARIAIALYEETGLPVLPTFIPVGQIYGLATISYAPPLSANVNMQVSFSISQPQNEQAVIDTPWVGIQESWINADVVAGVNYYWKHKTSNGPGVYVSNISVNYVIGTGFEPIAVTSTDQWQTDNASINALLANNSTFTGCPNGFLFQNTLGIFYANHSGSAYWAVQLIPAASGIPAFPSNPVTDGYQYLWIDRQGVFWYTGSSARTGGLAGTTTPLFSLALNIPFAPVTLPLVYPSLTGNCWSECLDRIGGRPGNLNPTGN